MSAQLLLLAVSTAGSSFQDASWTLPPSVRSSAGDMKIERLATFEFPWGIAALPDGRLLVTEKPGRLRIWDGGRVSAPVAGVPKVVYRGTKEEQGGLLDVAIHPDFASNRLVFLSYVEAASRQPAGAKEPGDPRFPQGVDKSDTIQRGGAVARGRLEGNRLRDVRVIWRQVPKTIGRGHFGHRLVFGPDRKLYITSGERMRFEPAQSLASNLGKVVRINADGTIPADNPFAGRSGRRSDIWSLGHRNMLSASFDPSGRLWVLEMGPMGGDELNLVQRGKNYGWPVVSNGDNYNGTFIPDHPTKKKFTEPLRTWVPVISPSGGQFYNGAMFPTWIGNLIVGGLSSKAIIRIAFDGNQPWIEERLDMNARIRDVAQARDGSLLAIVDDKRGHLIRLSNEG